MDICDRYSITVNQVKVATHIFRIGLSLSKSGTAYYEFEIEMKGTPDRLNNIETVIWDFISTGMFARHQNWWHEYGYSRFLQISSLNGSSPP